MPDDLEIKVIELWQQKKVKLRTERIIMCLMKSKIKIKMPVRWIITAKIKTMLIPNITNLC